MELRLEHLVKDFSETKAVNDVSITIQDGKLTGLLGPSGCGKSTTLYLISGLESPTSGRIFFGDRDVTALPPEKRGIGLVFQNYNLFPHYTVMKNITDAPIRVLKRPREQAEARAHELIAQMGLTGNENKVPCELSGGQQQRVSIARALALDPEILFFDEPTSALDPELTAEVLRVIKDLAAQNMTMVIVTHAMQFARDVADRVVFMDGGRIVEEGPAEQVIDHPREQRTREFLSRIEG